MPAVILAAGTSSRLAENKLLRLVEGIPVVRRAAAVYMASEADPVMVVAGHQEARLRQALAGLSVTICVNDAYRSGKASSIAAGVRAAPRSCPGILFAQADMPFVRVKTVNVIVRAFQGPDRIIVPTFEGKMGSPKLFGAAYFGELASLTGEQTGMEIIRRAGPHVVSLEVDDPGVLIDLDREEDFLRAARRTHG